MNDFSAPPIIRLRGCAPVHHVDDLDLCWFCFGKRFVPTNLRDENEYPICADCASRSVRAVQLPSFVIRHLMTGSVQ